MHFRTLLEGAGSQLLAGIAADRQVPQSNVLALLDSLVDLEFYMPVPAHWASWHGDANLIVASALRDHDVTAAFRLDGTAVTVDAEVPPRTPTLTIVPVEGDFSVGAATFALASKAPEVLASSSTNPAGIYMTTSSINDDFEGWLMGNPEFEVHVFADTDPNTVWYNNMDLVQIQCAGAHSSVSPSQRRYDQNNENSFTGNVLLVTETELNNAMGTLDTMPLGMEVWEHDSEGECGETNGRPAIDSLLLSADEITDLVTAGALCGVAVIANTGGAVRWALVAGCATMTISSINFIHNGGDDDFVGEVRATCDGGSAFSSGNYTIRGEDTYANGGMTLVNTIIASEGSACPLESVSITGPGTVTVVGGSGSPPPNYFADIEGGAGSTDTYQWKDNGVIKSTSSSYTISPLTIATHSLQLRVIRRQDTVITSRSITVSEDSGCPPMGC